jgi:lysophospholipase L1-like esterase
MQYMPPAIKTPWRAALVALLVTISGCAQLTNRVGGGAPATQPAPAGAQARDQYTSTIEHFEQLDRESPPRPGGTLFVGSSTFTKWTEIPTVFKEFDAANRAFGGSVSADQLKYMDRIVIPRKPAKIVYYCGENDIAAGAPAEQVAQNFAKFVEHVHAVLPQTKIYFVAMKICASRIRFEQTVRKGNDLVRAYIQQDPQRLRFVDINPVILDDQGKPLPGIYVLDNLHFNAKGYELITPLIQRALEMN